MNQQIIDRAVKIATRAAYNGHPVEKVIWLAPRTATEDPLGSFAVKYAEPVSASQKAPWD